MFILCFLSKFFGIILPRPVGVTPITQRLVTESVFRPASTFKPTVFRRRHLPYHLVQRCLHRSANRPGTPSSRWDHPSTLRPADIQSTVLHAAEAAPSRSYLRENCMYPLSECFNSLQFLQLALIPIPRLSSYLQELSGDIQFVAVQQVVQKLCIADLCDNTFM